MTIIPQTTENENTNISSILNFIAEYSISNLLKQCNGNKIKGIPAVNIFKFLVSNVFEDRSMYMQFVTGKCRAGCSKNTIYRFMNSVKTNWIKFTSRLASKVINNSIKHLTSDDRINAFVIDDSLFERTGYKSTELASRVFDHVAMKHKIGYRLLTLGWTDGNSFIPVNSTLLASSDSKNVLGPTYQYDKRSIAYHRRTLAQSKATSAMIELLATAKSSGIEADYVLMDTWFSNPAQIAEIKSLGLNTIAMIKKTDKRRYDFWGTKATVKEIFDSLPKHRGKSRYISSATVTTGPNNDVIAKIVFVKNRNNRKDWIAILSTCISLPEEEIIRIYGKRWKIEVFFKTCKSMLHLGHECHSTSYDALTAHVAIVFTRYIFLALEQRRNSDDRTIGELFYLMVDELEDISYAAAFQILIEAMIKSIQRKFSLSDEHISQLLCEFYEGLPKNIKNALTMQKCVA